ncbi:MAG TPA: tRNA pseudouridine(55) synthase TruB [Candidatus Eremiobacteraceae bacterium]|jgi:tRNA pseudouridine55 synthase|nr:tRNA pseudouridine(55) synthase TruB [Candidatus Eremiobacteraceae bacterium]
MPRQPVPAPYDGALVIDKPKGRTSHDVVDAVRHLAGMRQVGHLGTLDPLATGVLVVLLGRATRLVQFYSGRRKRYSAGFRFGFATNTFDSDGEAEGPDAAPALDRSLLERFAAERVGRFEQMPPSFSAKKIHGRPAYELARKKQVVELKPVEVEVFEYKLTEVDGYIARFVIECSSGTYIRALAHEMGQKLGCGAHLAEISRLAVGEFSLEQAIKLEELAEGARAGKFADYLIKLENLLPNFPRANVLPIVERRVRHGTKFNITVAQIQPGRVEAAPGATSELDGGEPKAPKLRVFNQQNKLIAIAEAVVPRTYQPVVVFDPMG